MKWVCSASQFKLRLGRTPQPGIVWGRKREALGGIESLANAATLELSPIRVNVLSPGRIGIRPYHNLVHQADQPDDLALAAIMMMANPATTGAVIDVDEEGDWAHGLDSRPDGIV